MILLVMLPHLDVLVGEGESVLSTILILTVAAWVIGWVLGGPDTGIRKVMVLGTSLRNVGLSVLIAAQSFPRTAVGATVTAYFLIQCIANMLLAKYLSRAIVPTETGASTKPH